MDKDVLRDWLRQGDPQRLLEWLRDDTLCPCDGEEPYVAVLRALPMGSVRYEAEMLLANRVADLLKKDPEKAVLGTHRSRILYNLLMLCTGIPFIPVLWEPLCDLHKRASREGTLDGEWCFVPLGSALRAALIAQQSDSRFREVWYDIIRQKPEPVLQGTPEDGMEGVRLLPGYNDYGQKTDYFNAVGKGLRMFADYLETFGDDKQAIFRQWVDRVTVTQSERHWCYHILKQADAEQWPEWAVACLSLYFVLDEGDGQTRRVCIWNRVLNAVLEQDEYEVEAELLPRCNQDKAVIIKVSNEKYEKFIKRVAPEFDYFRRTHDYPSPNALVSEFLHGLNYVKSTVTDPDLLARLNRSHEKTLSEANIQHETAVA